MGSTPQPRKSIRLVAALISLALVVLPLVLGEIVVRLTTSIQFLGNSENLFTPGRYGAKFGNTPGVEAISFGETAFTDSNGFRVPRKGYASPQNPVRSVLILGDSVAFGPGVPEPETFVGLLRSTHPTWAIYNSAVIGADVHDYEAVGSALVKTLPISQAYLVYCLNDLSAASAEELAQGKNASLNWVDRIRKVQIVYAINMFLRERSKLYLFLKNLVTDPGRRYFLADLSEYNKPQSVQDALATLKNIAETMKRSGVRFTVIVSPYEFQLRQGVRNASIDVELPQRLILGGLREAGIEAVDAREWLNRDKPAQYFLPGDPMHFSKVGHSAVFAGLQALVDQTYSGNQYKRGAGE